MPEERRQGFIPMGPTPLQRFAELAVVGGEILQDALYRGRVVPEACIVGGRVTMYLLGCWQQEKTKVGVLKLKRVGHGVTLDVGRVG
eukprot:758819-Hanusia_phi.AAC.2